MIFPPMIDNGCALPACCASRLAFWRPVLAGLPWVSVESGVMMSEWTGPRPQGRVSCLVLYIRFCIAAIG